MCRRHLKITFTHWNTKITKSFYYTQISQGWLVEYDMYLSKPHIYAIPQVSSNTAVEIHPAKQIKMKLKHPNSEKNNRNDFKILHFSFLSIFISNAIFLLLCHPLHLLVFDRASSIKIPFSFLPILFPGSISFPS